MASTLHVFNDTQGFTGDLQYLIGIETSVPTEALGWFKVDDVDALADKPTLSTNKGAIVDDIGGYGAGWYRWDGTSEEADDGLTIVAPTDGGVGRWIRI